MIFLKKRIFGATFYPMKRFLFIFCLLLRVTALTSAELRILCTADLHGELARFSALLPAMRRAAAGGDTLLIDLGDLSQGNFDVANAGFPVMTEALNRAGYELRVPGNHDFETDVPEFAAEVAAFRGTTLGADWSYGGISGTPWKLVERGGIRCAVIGLTDPKMQFRTAPDRQGRFTDPFTALTQTMREVRRANPDVVVLARHAGLQGFGGPLAKVLGEFPEIRIVLGAHTHEEHPGEEIAGAWYLQPGARASSAAMVTVTVDDRSRRVVNITSELIRPDPLAPDPELRKLSEEIHRRTLTLRRRHFPTNEKRYWQEILSETLRTAAGADAALSTCGTKATSLPAPRTEAELFGRQPYHDGILCFRLSGQEYRELCRAERKRLRKYSSLLVVAGIAPERASAEITVAVSEYFATTSPMLSGIMRRDASRWRRVPGTVRDRCREFLLNGAREHRPR